MQKDAPILRFITGYGTNFQVCRAAGGADFKAHGGRISGVESFALAQKGRGREKGKESNEVNHWTLLCLSGAAEKTKRRETCVYCTKRIALL